MALKVMDMAELRLKVIQEPELTGDTVAEVCRRHGISRDTFYEYKRRFLAEGIDGLEPRSRRPYRSPGQMDADLEIEICRLRKDHKDWGARSIRNELVRIGIDPPAISTIHQALRRNHLVADQPKKSPKFLKRFERESPNDLWQIDATQVKLRGGRKGWVVDLLDDHARYLLSAVACSGPTGDAAWNGFEQAASRYGHPRQVLSDNGFCFTGRLLGFEVEFERRLKDLGIQLINSGPYHPQTLGKLERFHKTLKQWLADQDPPSNLDELQQLLDTFREHYNQERPHQGIGDITPATRFFPDGSPPPPVPVAQETININSTEVVTEESVDASATETLSQDPVYPPYSILRKVDCRGVITYERLRIVIGRRWGGAQVRLVVVGRLIHIYHGETMIRSVAPDPNRSYQAKGKPSLRR